MKVLVNNIHQACRYVKVFELTPMKGYTLPPFDAGAHIDVHLGNGLIRQYSLCNNPAQQDRYWIGVLLNEQSRGGSQYIHNCIGVGDELKISKPRNLFPLVQGQHKALLLAGGIGITPLMAMVETLLMECINFELYYFCRGGEYIVFKERLTEAHLDGIVNFVHKNREGAHALLYEILKEPIPKTHLYTCGPQGFMDSVLEVALANGWHNDHLHKESFSLAGIEAEKNQAFQIQIASTGEILDIPQDKSITQVLESHGYFIPVSCEQGICGTCMTRILEGEAEHHDHFLTDDEKHIQKFFTPCCSRSKSSLLVIDL